MGAAMIIFGTIIFLLFAGGAGYWFFIKSNPKMKTWNAIIYQMGESHRSIKKDNEEIYKLNDLKHYGTDVLVRQEIKPGVTAYYLRGLKKTVSAPTADCVDYRKDGTKVVEVLYAEDSCTLMKKGYDKETGSKIFLPMPYDDISMTKSEIDMRKARFKQKGEIWATITPFITTAIMGVFLVAAVWFAIDGMIEINERQIQGIEKMSKDNLEATQNIKAGLQAIASSTGQSNIYEPVEEPPTLGKQPD